MDSAELIVYGSIDLLPDDAESVIQDYLSDHSIERYPEGAYIATFAPSDLQPNIVGDPAEIEADPYPHNIKLTEFPPEEGDEYNR